MYKLIQTCRGTGWAGGRQVLNPSTEKCFSAHQCCIGTGNSWSKPISHLQSCCERSTCCTSNNSSRKLNITAHTVLGNSHLHLPWAPCEKLTACGHTRLSSQPSSQRPRMCHPVTPSGIAHAEISSGRAQTVFSQMQVSLLQMSIQTLIAAQTLPEPPSAFSFQPPSSLCCLKAERLHPARGSQRQLLSGLQYRGSTQGENHTKPNPTRAGGARRRDKALLCTSETSLAHQRPSCSTSLHRINQQNLSLLQLP